jgi:hypothetical protein
MLPLSTLRVRFVKRRVAPQTAADFSEPRALDAARSQNFGLTVTTPIYTIILTV